VRTFLELATRVHGGKVLAPEETSADRRGRRPSWLRWPKPVPAIGKQ
jgi:hypothetical protein